MEKTNHVLKGLGQAYILTLLAILIYNLALTFTNISGDTIAMISSGITTIAAAYGGFYASKRNREKGLLYGLLVGFMYIVCLMTVVFLARDSFNFDMGVLYKTLLVSLAGGIGGVLGVNFK